MKFKLFLSAIFLTYSLLLGSGCSHGPTVRISSRLSEDNYDAGEKRLPVYAQPNASTTQLLAHKNTSRKKSLKQTLKFTKSLIGKRYASSNKKKFAASSSGTVRAIYNYMGIPLANNYQTKDKNDVAFIYQQAQKKGQIDRQNIALLDLVFFNNTFDRNRNNLSDDKLTHVGVVEKVLPDGTIIFVHYLGKSIIRSKMNLQHPSAQFHPKSKKRINHLLKRATKRYKAKTAAELFAGFGRFSS